MSQTDRIPGGGRLGGPGRFFRSVGLVALLVVSSAALPPSCTPIPVDALGDAHPDCVRLLCEPGSGACAFARRLPDGAPCGDGAGVCAAGRCDCAAACGDRACGPDGCGGSCGACAAEEFCSVGTCLPEGVGPGFSAEIVGEYPNEATAIAVDGDLAVLGAGHVLFTLDRSQPPRTAELGRVVLPGWASIDDVAVRPRKGLAYVVRAGTFEIVDVHDPRAPRLRGSLALDRARDRVALRGDVAFVSGATEEQDSDDVVHVVHIGDPDAPRLLASLPSGEPERSPWPTDFALHGNFLYWAVAGWLAVVDVSDPAAPRLVRWVDAPSHTPWESTPSGFRALDIEGDRLVAAGSTLALFDLADPAAPRLLASVVHSWDRGRRLRDVLLHDGRIYAAGDGYRSLSVYDVGAPPALVLAQTSGRNCYYGALRDLFDTDCIAWRLARADDDGFLLAYGPHGLVHLTWDAPSVHEARPVFPTAGYVQAIQPGDGFLLLASRRPGLTVLDVSGRLVPGASLERPKVVAVLEIPPSESCSDPHDECAPTVEGVVLHGTTAYATYNRAVYTVDVSDPLAPTVLATTPAPVEDPFEGTYYYLGVRDDLLSVLPSQGNSIVGSAFPFLLPLHPASHLPAAAPVLLDPGFRQNARGILVSADHASMVTANSEGPGRDPLQSVTFDLRTPTAPRLECAHLLPTDDVLWAGRPLDGETMLYLTENSLLTLDLSFPCSAVVTRSIPGSFHPTTGMFVEAPVAYVTDQLGVFAWDVRPEHEREAVPLLPPSAGGGLARVVVLHGLRRVERRRLLRHPRDRDARAAAEAGLSYETIEERQNGSLHDIRETARLALGASQDT